MEFYTQALQDLIAEFEKLPGIGAKTAERLAYYVLRASEEDAMRLAYSIRDVKKNVKNCRVCFNITELDECSICTDDRRDATKICVVEQPKDVYAIERADNYDGKYHVLMGAFSPMDGVTPDDLTIQSLIDRVHEQTKSGQPVQEVILATNPNFEGDGTAAYLRDQLAGIEGLTVSRIARGIPSGSNLDHASRTIVADALEGRRSMEAG